MSRSTIRNQLFLNDGFGHKLPISTGTWVTPAVNIDEHRRISVTLGIGSATGAVGDFGGFTGVLSVQGTNELAQCNGMTGTPEAGNTSRPGLNGFTGALYWVDLPGGQYNVDNTTKAVLLDVNELGVAFVRVVFNPGIPVAIGSGTMNVFLTAKNT